MGSAFMLCTVDQESGVHGILIPMSTLCWVVPPRGTTRTTVSTGRLNYLATLLAMQGMPLLTKTKPTAYSCGWRQQGHAAIENLMKMQRKVSAPTPRHSLNGQGVLRIPGSKINEKKVEKRIGVRFGSWNVGSISGRGAEVCEELRKRKVDVCCSQEVRWRGEGARFLASREEGTNYGGVEMMIKLEVWVYW